MKKQWWKLTKREIVSKEKENNIEVKFAYDMKTQVDVKMYLIENLESLMLNNGITVKIQELYVLRRLEYCANKLFNFICVTQFIHEDNQTCLEIFAYFCTDFLTEITTYAQYTSIGL